MGDDWPDRDPPGANRTAAGEPWTLWLISPRPSSEREANESCADDGRGVGFVLRDVSEEVGSGVLFF